MCELRVTDTDDHIDRVATDANKAVEGTQDKSGR